MAGSMTRLPKSFRLDRPVHAVFGSIYEVRTEEPIVHLTYDDGPHPEVTPAARTWKPSPVSRSAGSARPTEPTAGEACRSPVWGR